MIKKYNIFLFLLSIVAIVCLFYKDGKTIRNLNSGNLDNGISIKENELIISTRIPDNFILKETLFPEAKLIGSLISSSGTLIKFEVSRKPDEVINFFKDKLKEKGYLLNKSSDSFVKEDVGILTWEKDNKNINLSFKYWGNITKFVISYI